MLQTFPNRKSAVKPQLSAIAIDRLSALENNAGMDAAWLKAEIDRRGILQRELAEAMGISESTLSKIFGSGDKPRKITGNEAMKALRFLGYPVPAPGAEERPLDIIVRYAAKLDESQQRALAAYLESQGD